MAQLGTAPHVVEKLLNHRTGTISGVAAVYNCYQFMDEMRQAIEKYDHHLAKFLQSPSQRNFGRKRNFIRPGASK
jgi:hypothetical protein